MDLYYRGVVYNSFSSISIKTSLAYSSSSPDADALMNKVFTLDNVGHALIVFCFMFLMALIAGLFTGKKLKMIAASFPVVFFLTLLAMVVGGNKFLKDWGFETVIFSLLIGLFISNIFSIPKWLKESLSSELFVKIGLVLLGTTVLFDDLLKAGALGLIQSCVVVFTVWNFCFWLCRKMKIDKEMSLMLSSAVSICGVSAAVATAGAIKGDKTKLSYVVSLVLVVAVPMILIMPGLAKLMGLPEDMAGAWIGGTIDTTGAVAATGAIYGEVALQTSTIVKFSQNVLLGVAAFLNQYLLVLFEERGYRRETDVKSNLVAFSEIRVGIRCCFSCFFILRCSRGRV